MSLEAKALYKDVIVDHGKRPHNHGALPEATHEATANNPLCGDRVTLRLCVEADRIAEARFEARGCMIATASGSLLTEALRGLSIDEALALADTIDVVVSGGDLPADLGDLEALRGAREFPGRKACVTLAWQALRAAIKGGSGATRPSPR